MSSYLNFSMLPTVETTILKGLIHDRLTPAEYFRTWTPISSRPFRVLLWICKEHFSLYDSCPTRESSVAEELDGGFEEEYRELGENFEVLVENPQNFDWLSIQLRSGKNVLFPCCLDSISITDGRQGPWT